MKISKGDVGDNGLGEASPIDAEVTAALDDDGPTPQPPPLRGGSRTVGGVGVRFGKSVDRADGQELAAAALRGYDDAGPRSLEQAKVLKAWLEAHPQR
jgi:hypothetical protein